MSHDRNVTNLILDYPRESLAFFAAAEAADGFAGAEVTPLYVRNSLKNAWGSASLSSTFPCWLPGPTTAARPSSSCWRKRPARGVSPSTGSRTIVWSDGMITANRIDDVLH